MVFKVRLAKKIEVSHNGKTAQIALNEKANERGQLDFANIYDQLKASFSIPDDQTITGFALDDGGAICHFDLLKGLRGGRIIDFNRSTPSPCDGCTCGVQEVKNAYFEPFQLMSVVEKLF